MPASCARLGLSDVDVADAKRPAPPPSSHRPPRVDTSPNEGTRRHHGTRYEVPDPLPSCRPLRRVGADPSASDSRRTASRLPRRPALDSGGGGRSGTAGPSHPDGPRRRHGCRLLKPGIRHTPRCDPKRCVLSKVHAPQPLHRRQLAPVETRPPPASPRACPSTPAPPRRQQPMKTEQMSSHLLHRR